MGKRKSSKKPVARKQNEPLSTTFKCLFCHHEKSVNVKIDKQNMFGNLSCKTCGQKFTTPINNLSAAVDVYCDWVDACEEAKAKAPPPKKAKPAKPRSPSPPRAAASPHYEDDYGDDDDDGEDDLAAALSKRKDRHHEYDDDEDDHRRSKAARRAYDSDDDE